MTIVFVDYHLIKRIPGVHGKTRLGQAKLPEQSDKGMMPQRLLVNTFFKIADRQILEYLVDATRPEGPTNQETRHIL